uniref:G protein signaling modulator 1a n=1 Tax=Electrophorus electricus TaxID=8005 RepID=A0A4W4E434_ELEEL
QREEFFELVATSQGRRLDDQRAEFHSLPLTPAAPQTAPTPPHKEELYNMIVISQAQGRLEEQRSAAPGPMDDEDFFSLLLKVQGGRMDEQRTELPAVISHTCPGW